MMLTTIANIGGAYWRHQSTRAPRDRASATSLGAGNFSPLLSITQRNGRSNLEIEPMKKILATAAAAGALLTAHAASAQTATGELEITLNVVSGCELAIGNGPGTGTGGVAEALLDFGSVTIFGGDRASRTDAELVTQVGTGTVGGANTFTVNCGPGIDTDTTPVTIAFDEGANGDAGQRYLVNGTASVAYNLAALQTGASPYAAGTPVPLTLDADGRAAIPIWGLPQDVASTAVIDGDYTDTVTLTLTF